MTKHMDSVILSNNLLEAALDGIGGPLFLIDDSARICYVNTKACELLGYTAGELSSMYLTDIDTSFPDTSWPSGWSLLKEKHQLLFETGYRTKDGNILTVELKVNRFVFSEVDYYLVLASSIDIDSSVDSEQNWLKKLISDFLLNSADWLWEVDEKGRFVYVSGKIRNILGYEPEEAIGKTLFDFMQDDEAERVGEIFETFAANREAIVDFECRKIHKDGSTVCLLTNGTPIIASSGDLLGYRGVSKDITLRVEAEKAIRDEHALLNSLLDAIPDPIFIKDMEDVFLYTNKAFNEFVEKSDEEIIGKLVTDTCSNCNQGCFCRTDISLFESGNIGSNTPLAQCGKKPNVWLDTIKKPCFSSDGEQIGVIGVSRDITEHHLREKVLKLNEQRLALAQSIAHLGNWNWDIEQGKLHWSDEVFRIFGHQPQSFEESYEAFLQAVHIEDREEVSNCIQQSITLHIPYYIEHRIAHADGSIKMVREQGAVLYDKDGNAKSMSGTVQDITVQHLAEQQLKLRLKYEEGLADCSRVLLSNNEMVIDTALEHLRSTIDSSRIYIFRNYDDREHGLSAICEHEVCVEGIIPYCDDPQNRVLYYADGEIFKYLDAGNYFAFTLDLLSERERSTLQELGVQSGLLFPVYVSGKWYGFIGIDENTYERQWSRDDLLFMSTTADMFSSYFSRIDAHNALIDGYDILETAVEEHKKKIDILGKNLWNGLAERRLKEAELKESEERFKQLADNTTEGFWISDISSLHPIYVNPAFLNIWGLSKLEDPLSDFDFMSYLIEEDDRKKFIKLIFEGTFDAPVLIEYQIRRDDGSIRWLRDKISPVYNDSNQVYRVAGLTEDVTEQKEMEAMQQLEAQKQRDGLVREVHHRIKNHLQGITGLLSNEAFKKPEIRTYLDNAIGQINAISMIHGLQGNDTSENVNLSTLLASISNSLEQVSLMEIRLSNNLQDTSCCYLNQVEAVPVSLILNELLQNAVKHSLPGQSDSVVQLEISKSGKIVLIRISNTVDYSFSTEILESGKGNGLSLVRSMMPAEGAALSIENNEGIFSIMLELQPPVIVQGAGNC